MRSARVEQTLERFQEDERLTSDLTDDTATALLEWIEQHVQAADALPDASTFEQQVAAIRSAARTAASTRTDDPTPATVVEQAEAALQASAPSAAAPPAPAGPGAGAPATTAQVSAPQTGPDAAAPATALPTPIPSLWRTLRRRVRRWTHRKAS